MVDRIPSLTRGILAAAMVGAAAVPVGAQPFGRVTISAAEIEAAGWHRLAELLEGAVGFSRASVDGFTYAIAGDRLPVAGVAAPGTGQVVILVDGRRLPVSVGGAHLLDLIPLTVQQVDSVTVTRGPAVVAGILAPRGAVEFHTKVRPRGLFGGLGYQIGDETGDPGPFRYTELSSPNVERIGPFTQVLAGFDTYRWGIEAGRHTARFNSSDTLITHRLPPGTLTPDNEYVMVETNFLRARLSAVGEHSVMLSRGIRDGFLFVFDRGSERAIDATFSAASLGGVIPFERIGVRYAIDATRMEVSGFASLLPPPEPHRRSTVSGRAEAAGEFGGTEVIVGAGSFVGRLQGGVVELPDDSTVWSHTLHASASRVLSPDVRVAANLVVGLGRYRPSASPSITATVSPTTDTEFFAKLAYQDQSQWSSDSWIDRAIFLPGASAWRASTVGGSAGFSRRGVIATECEGTVSATRGVEVVSAAEPSAPLPDDGMMVRGHVSSAGIRCGASTDAASPLSARVEYAANRAISAPPALRGALRSIPSQELRATVRWSPMRSVRFGAAVWLSARTRWDSPAIRSGSVDLGPLTRVDLTAEKWLWSRRIRAQAAFRNVLDGEERHHPLGAQWNMRTYLSLTAVFR